MKRMAPIVLALLVATILAACGSPTPPPAVTGVVVTPSTETVEVSATVSLSATVQPAGVSQSVTWSSDSPSVATVDSSGVVTGVNAGTAVITATSVVDASQSGFATVTVVDGDPATVDCDDPTPLSGPITSDTTLPLDCYSVTGTVDVRDGATLTIQPGAILRFANNVGLRVHTDGALVAAGTTSNPITLTSTSSIAGSWLGVYIQSNDPANVLRHVRTEYAGQFNFSFHGANGIGAGTRVAGGARVEISNSTYRGNNAAGVRLESDATVTNFVQNAFDANDGTPVRLRSNQLGMLDVSSDFGGTGAGRGPNTANHVFVLDSNVTTSQTWDAINVPYRLSGFTNIDGAGVAVTVSPGATFEGTNGSGVRVRNDAALTVRGTEGDPIVFRGVSSIPGTWIGLYYLSNNPENALEHVTVEAAGQFDFSFHGANGIGAGVRVANGARVTISDSTFRTNNATGIRLNVGAIVTDFANNVFDENAGTPMDLNANQIGMLDGASDYAGAGAGLVANTDNHIHVRGNTVTDAQTWPAANVPYRLNGTTNIDGANSSVTIAPGAEFRGTTNSGIRVRDDASFIAQGTEDERIHFRGVSSVAGSWIGIYVQTNSADNLIQHVTIEHGGQPNFSFHGANTIGANIRLGGGARLELRENIINDSQTAGVRLQNGSTLVPENPLDTNSFARNGIDEDVVDLR